MKFLALADLHMTYHDAEEMTKVEELINSENPDVILIAGDVFESFITFSPYKALSKFGKKIVCCLGNHEFSGKPVTNTISFYKHYYDPERYDVHYLDITGNVRIPGKTKDINIVGNVLWYDGSFKDIPTQSDTAVDPRWLDATIANFDFKKENKKCIEQIESNYDPNCYNILLTHCCPDRRLNLFSSEGPGWPNMYSGCEFLKNTKYHFDWVVCGHTHRRTNCEINCQNCINIGNDYSMYQVELKYFTFEVED